MEDGEREPSPAASAPSGPACSRSRRFMIRFLQGDEGGLCGGHPRAGRVYVEDQEMTLSYHGRPGKIPTRLLRASSITPPLRGSRSEAPPGNAGVPPASLFLAGGRGASARGCRQAATLPPDPARSCLQASSITPPLRGSRREGEARLRAGGGQTRRRVSDSPRERGRPARNLIPGWRRWSDSARLPAGSHPAGVNCDGQSK